MLPPYIMTKHCIAIFFVRPHFFFICVRDIGKFCHKLCAIIFVHYKLTAEHALLLHVNPQHLPCHNFLLPCTTKFLCGRNDRSVTLLPASQYKISSFNVLNSNSVHRHFHPEANFNSSPPPPPEQQKQQHQPLQSSSCHERIQISCRVSWPVCEVINNSAATQIRYTPFRAVGEDKTTW